MKGGGSGSIGVRSADRRKDGPVLMMTQTEPGRRNKLEEEGQVGHRASRWSPQKDVRA